MAMLRTKRTYNLSKSTVDTVRDLATAHHVAPSQDAVVELAVERLARSVRDREHAAAWAAAARDPAFVRENEQIAEEFRTADQEAWAE